MHIVSGVITIKQRSKWKDDDKNKVYYNLHAKNIITFALNPGECFRVSNYHIVQQIWDTLQVTHEGTSAIKRVRTNTLI